MRVLVCVCGVLIRGWSCAYALMHRLRSKKVGIVRFVSPSHTPLNKASRATTRRSAAAVSAAAARGRADAHDRRLARRKEQETETLLSFHRCVWLVRCVMS